MSEHPSTTTVTTLTWRPTSPTFGARLRASRIEYGNRIGRKLTQARFAEILGMNTATLGSWEADVSKPHDIVATAKQFEHLIGIDAKWLLGLDDDSPQAPNPPPGHDGTAFTCNDVAAIPGQLELLLAVERAAA